MEKFDNFDDSATPHLKRRYVTTRFASSSIPGPVLQSSDEETVGEDKRSRNRRPAFGLTLPIDVESGRRKPALVRSKTFDHSLLSQNQSDGETKAQRKKSQYNQLSKTNSQYHKMFKEISKDELLRQSYTCALQKDMLYQGRLFVSDNWICFHSKVFGKDTKIAIPVLSVSMIKKTKTAILVPNALVIATTNDRYVFVSFLSRDTTYKFLMDMCFHLKEKSPGSSPIPSSVESSFRAERPSHFPLNSVNFSADFCDLDGAVRPREDWHESSSSDSQAPDYEKIAEFPNLPPPFLGDVLGDVPVLTDINLQQLPDTNQEMDFSSSSKTAEVVCIKRTQMPVSLNNVLFIYLSLVCVLVLSSCYMAFKIISLEQKLTTLGALTKFSHLENEYLRTHPDVNAGIYSELTLNLMKLEKVQRNLQRLLKEAE
ncbi:GRAM domain-containing protein 2B isoform X2 [Esox lucius]|uniref:GRAM domain-containing protein n=1 Tax=Esox lucius TaxID=8010 RepID=A0A3P8XQS7_ESOLU|nr:GRAM domain-containing protein 2B isoform X2 [Esox lucius]